MPPDARPAAAFGIAIRIAVLLVAGTVALFTASAIIYNLVGPFRHQVNVVAVVSVLAGVLGIAVTTFVFALRGVLSRRTRRSIEHSEGGHRGN